MNKHAGLLGRGEALDEELLRPQTAGGDAKLTLGFEEEETEEGVFSSESFL